ncbi:MAG: DJ-1/PfpI family protein [Flavobacteriales bacterium]|nr:DJ-1/PfpI family protein [Flavobacteriales bacterium]
MYDILSRAGSLANELYGKSDDSVGFSVKIISVDGQKVIYSDSGFPIYCDLYTDIRDQADIVIIPALRSVKEDSSDKELMNWLKSNYQNGSTICSVCTGVDLRKNKTV